MIKLCLFHANPQGQCNSSYVVLQPRLRFVDRGLSDRRSGRNRLGGIRLLLLGACAGMMLRVCRKQCV